MSIPFDVPAQFLTRVSDGSLVRFGALLKDSSSGQIVAHLQETGLVPHLLGAFPNLALSPLQMVNTGVSVYNSLQLRQLTSLVQTLQTLQYATLGVALVGIGVSAAGFAMMNRRLKAVEGAVAHLTTTTERLFKELHWRELRAWLASASSFLERAENAHRFREPGPELRGAAERLGESSAFFKSEVQFMLQQERLNPTVFRSLTYALMLCDTTRVDCLVEANEMSGAMSIAEQIGLSYSSLFDQLDSVSLVRRIAFPSTANNRRSHSELREIRLTFAEPLVQMLREATHAAITRPLLIESLANDGIDGAIYLERVRKESNEPILLLPVQRKPIV